MLVSDSKHTTGRVGVGVRACECLAYSPPLPTPSPRLPRGLSPQEIQTIPEPGQTPSAASADVPYLETLLMDRFLRCALMIARSVVACAALFPEAPS